MSPQIVAEVRVHIDRVFTKFSEDQSDPYSKIEFVERTSKITNADGSIVSQIEQVLVPTLWSQVAVDIMAQKYFRKAGVPARLKKKIEDGVPRWLCPSEEDTEALSGLSELERMGAKRIRVKYFIAWQAAGPIGVGKTKAS